MSKRLRASMRAANKGRNLRPRNSVPHGPPTSDAPPGSSSSDPLLQLVGEDDDAPDSQRESEPASPTKPSLVAPAAGLKSSLTHAEVPGATASFSATRDEAAAAANLRAEQAEAARAEEAARAMRVRADELRKSEEAARVAREKAEEAARAEESARAAREKAEATARAAKAEDARKSEQAARNRKADEAAKVAKVKAEESRRAEETRKADEAAKSAKAKADDSAKLRARDDARKTDAKKGTPARMDEARSKKASAKPRDEDEATARKAGAARPIASATSLDDDHDPSSISAEFFRKDEDSVPPVEEGDEGMVPAGLVLSPAALARRARLRRLVAGVVSFAAVISIAVVGKTVAAQKRTPSAPMPVAMEVKHDAPKPPEPPPVAEVKPAPVAEAPKTEPAKADDKKAEEPAKVDDKKAEEVAKADDKKADDKKAEEPAKPAPSGGDAEALRKETESLLNRGKRKEAIEKAREAIAADPSHAMPYLFLGSALQDSGKWKDGIEAYSECVRNATKGPVNECRAMGGHK